MTRPWTLSRLALTLVVCAIAWLLVAGLAMFVSSSTAPAWARDSFVFQSRLDRVALASLVGAALAAAGVAFQAVLRNALADPYLLGVAAGASLGAYLWRLPAIAAFMIALGEPWASMSLQTFALVGGLLAAIIVFSIAGLRGRLEPATLVLAGVIVSAIVGSLTLLVYTLARSLPGSGYFQAVFIGELQTNLEPAQFNAALIVSVICAIVLMTLAGSLNITSLSDDEARSLGLRLNRVRWIALLAATLLTAAAVAVSGPVAFVGLVAPHLARLMVGVDNRRVLPVSMTLGAILLVLADASARLAVGMNWIDQLLPIGVLTSLVGGPFFLMLLVRQRGAST